MKPKFDLSQRLVVKQCQHFKTTGRNHLSLCRDSSIGWSNAFIWQRLAEAGSLSLPLGTNVLVDLLDGSPAGSTTNYAQGYLDTTLYLRNVGGARWDRNLCKVQIRMSAELGEMISRF